MTIKRGFTLIETIIYISILTIVISGLFMTITSILNSKSNRNYISNGDYEKLIRNFHEE